METAKSINPATGELLKEYSRIEKEAVERRIIEAHERFKEWKDLSFSQRAEILNNAGDLLEANKKEYARLITQEMGKTLAAATKEVEKCAWVLHYFADEAEHFLQDEIVKTEAVKSFVTFNPLGVILAIMPWNFPFYQAIRFAAPALMAGNTALLKHASNVQGCAEAIEDIFLKAGCPPNVFSNINIPGEAVESIIANPKVAAVTLTGSVDAGRSVAAVAGKHLKKCVMELGGSDAYIITDDTDIDKAVELCVRARLQNNGQTCIAGKRFIVYENICDEFVEKFTAAMASKKMGDPLSSDTFYGPMVNIALRNELHEQVKESIAQGAELKTGGFIPEMKGAYYPATVLTNVKPGMTAFDKELFGPVAAVVKAKDERHAIELANNSEFGLGGAILTQDLQKGERIAATMMEAGSAFVNSIVVSDPRLPFGGIKNSGFGRELSSYGIKEFVNIKTVWVDELK